MFPEIPKTDQEMAQLKKYIFSNPSYNGTLVASDGTAALIFTEVRDYVSYDRVFELFRSIDETYSDEETSVHIVGYPMLMGWIYSYKTQMFWVFGISVGLMVIILYGIFRNIVGMVAPFCHGCGVHRARARIYRLDGDQLQPPALCPCLPRRGENAQQCRSDNAPVYSGILRLRAG